MHSGDKGLSGVVYSGQVLRQEAIGWDALISVGPPPSPSLTLTLKNRGPHLSPSDGEYLDEEISKPVPKIREARWGHHTERHWW